MKTKIYIEVNDDRLYIREDGADGKRYQISDDMPSMVFEICHHLANYLNDVD